MKQIYRRDCSFALLINKPLNVIDKVSVQLSTKVVQSGCQHYTGTSGVHLEKALALHPICILWLPAMNLGITIQIFHLGWYIIRYSVGNFVLPVTRQRIRKTCDLTVYI